MKPTRVSLRWHNNLKGCDATSMQPDNRCHRIDHNWLFPAVQIVSLFNRSAGVQANDMTGGKADSTRPRCRWCTNAGACRAAPEHTHRRALPVAQEVVVAPHGVRSILLLQCWPPRRRDGVWCGGGVAGSWVEGAGKRRPARAQSLRREDTVTDGALYG